MNILKKCYEWIIIIIFVKLLVLPAHFHDVIDDRMKPNTVEPHINRF